MPVLVQWKWQEKTKTFLIIFHFFDDYSNTNLRCKNERISDKSLISVQHEIDFQAYNKDTLERPVVTWSPSHIEIGYLSDVLKYANIVNGLSEIKKRNLRIDLEYSWNDPSLGKEYRGDQNRLAQIWEELDDKHILFSLEKENGEIHFHFRGIELCLEYIDYLKEVLKPYL